MDVAVLAGGRSPEHDISLASARQVLRHLDRSRWRVWPVFLDRDGWWWTAREPLEKGETWRAADPADSCGPLRPGAALDDLIDRCGTGVVFPVLHGPNGEDGTLQGMLELYRLPFVGAGCAASAVAMDKLRARRALAVEHVPMAAAYESPFVLGALEARAQGGVEAEFARVVEAIGLPCFAKVDTSGSSRGIARVTGFPDFARFARDPAFRARRWFAEAAVEGEEVTVAVLGNTESCGGSGWGSRGPAASHAEPRALPVIGIYPRHAAHFDERAKYEPGACDEVSPPRGLTPAQCEEVQALALRCHRALRCDGMSRTDLIWGKDGPVVLELNTIPGLTETSLLPQAAGAAGLSFRALLDELLELALDRAGVADPVMP